MWAPLGPIGPLGAVGPLGPLGPIGAHGYLANANGEYIDTDTGQYANMTEIMGDLIAVWR